MMKIYPEPNRDSGASFLPVARASRRLEPGAKPKFPWRVALIAKLKDKDRHSLGDPPEVGAEFDQQETIDALTAALKSDGHTVKFCSADRTLPRVLSTTRPHICFNIAEGMDVDGREAQAPALFELVGIPYQAPVW